MVAPLEPAATTILETSTGYPGEESSYKQVGHISRMAGLRLRDVNRHGDGSDESIRSELLATGRHVRQTIRLATSWDNHVGLAVENHHMETT